MNVPTWSIVKKILSIFLAIIVILTVNFCLFYVLLGDPHNIFNMRGGSPELRDLRIERFHLDDPIYLQYFHYIADTLTGDLRTAGFGGGMVEIGDLIWGSIGFTLLLFVTIVSLSIAFGVFLEYLALRVRSRVTSHAVHFLSLVLISIPVLSLGILLLHLSIELDIGLPLGGNGTERTDGGLGAAMSILRHLLLPALTGVLATVGMLVLLARAGISELAYSNRTLKEETHQISRRKSIFLGLFLIRPFLQFFLALTMSCVLTIDILFSYGGLGERFWTAVYYRDFALMMACFFVISMIVLAADIVASSVLSLARGKKFRDSAVGWVHHERRSKKAQRIQRARISRRTALFEFAKKMWKEYKRSTLGMVALLALIVLIAAGVLAPLLSTVDDPMNLLRSLDDRNLPPSFERSPTTGWLHPLGTDHYGRDVYSMWLYAAKHAVFDVLGIALGAILIGVLVGVAASKTTRMDERLASLLDFLLTIPARAFLAIPFYVLAMAAFLVMAMAGHRWMNASSVFLILAIYSWAWVVVARRVRAHARAKSGVESEVEVVVSSRVMLPAILSSTLLVAKFAVAAFVIWQASLGFFGLGTRSETWIDMLLDAYQNNAFLLGNWHLILPPILGIFLVTASVFVVLDRLEAVANNIEGEPSADAIAIAVPEADTTSQ